MKRKTISVELSLTDASKRLKDVHSWLLGTHNAYLTYNLHKNIIIVIVIESRKEKYVLLTPYSEGESYYVFYPFSQ